MSRTAEIFDEMKDGVEAIGPELQKKFTGIVKFDIVDVGTWTLDLKTGNGTVVKGDGGMKKPDLVIRVGEADFAQLYDGKLNAQQAFMKGKLKVKGNMSLAMKFNTVLTATRKQFESTQGSAPAKKAPASSSAAAPSAAGNNQGKGAAPKATIIFQELEAALATQGPALVNKMKGVVLFDIEGEKWLVSLKSGNGNVAKGGEGPADLTVAMSDDTFFQVSQGKVTAQQAFMKGNIKIKGNMGMATKLGPILQAARPRPRL